ncbi:unnamed protein product, partial [Pelagomonas calceolata]
ASRKNVCFFARSSRYSLTPTTWAAPLGYLSLLAAAFFFLSACIFFHWAAERPSGTYGCTLLACMTFQACKKARTATACCCAARPRPPARFRGSMRLTW